MSFLKKAYNTAKDLGKKAYHTAGTGIKKVREIAQDVKAISPLLMELLNDASDLIPGVSPLKSVAKYGMMGLDSINSFANKVDSKMAETEEKHAKLGVKARKIAGNRTVRNIDKFLNKR